MLAKYFTICPVDCIWLFQYTDLGRLQSGFALHIRAGNFFIIALSRIPFLEANFPDRTEIVVQSGPTSSVIQAHRTKLVDAPWSVLYYHNLDSCLRSFPVLASGLDVCTTRTFAAVRQANLVYSLWITHWFVQRVVSVRHGTRVCAGCRECPKFAGADELFKTKFCPDKATACDMQSLHA